MFFKSSPQFPWYDSLWLSQYALAKKYLSKRQPDKLQGFEQAMEAFRTPKNFEVKKLTHALIDQELSTLQKIVHEHKINQWERHELERFGRLVLHNHPKINDIQESLIPRMSEWVGEEVEVSYNFLCLYHSLGKCPVHMDAPQAKWTLDVCLGQSRPWPIEFSQIVDWPEDFNAKEKNWETVIRQDDRLNFQPYVMEPGEALVFSGSSQWHVRDPIDNMRDDDFCDLVFFHFVPKGMKRLSDANEWADFFGIPALSKVIRKIR